MTCGVPTADEWVREIEAVLRLGVPPIFLVGLVALAERDPEQFWRALEVASGLLYEEKERNAIFALAKKKT